MPEQTPRRGSGRWSPSTLSHGLTWRSWASCRRSGHDGGHSGGGGGSLDDAVTTVANSRAVRRAIEAGSVEALRSLLSTDPILGDRRIRWGPCGCNASPPIHYVCDLVFSGRLDGATSGRLADVLLEAGADVGRGSLLLNAASLGAEEVGLRLLSAGAPIDDTDGPHEATALHWAAMLGLGYLTVELVAAGADVLRVDATFGASPLGWAVHGAAEGAHGSRGAYEAVARALVDAGADASAADCSRLADPTLAPMRRVLCGPSAEAAG